MTALSFDFFKGLPISYKSQEAPKALTKYIWNPRRTHLCRGLIYISSELGKLPYIMPLLQKSLRTLDLQSSSYTYCGKQRPDNLKRNVRKAKTFAQAFLSKSSRFRQFLQYYFPSNFFQNILLYSTTIYVKFCTFNVCPPNRQ